MSIFNRLVKRNLIQNYPGFLKNNIHYEVMMGSVAYGVSSNDSDIDVYGFCIPPKHIIFPHLSGEIFGFGAQNERFEQFQEHHIEDKEGEKEYDITIYSIIKYFQLCMQNNPNMIDSLFVPRRCIIHSTQIGEHVREHRKEFLHKGSWFKFKGYAYSQVHKMQIKNPEVGSTRYEMVQQYGYDLKFAYHVVRLLNEIEQILTEHDLDLERNREQLKSIRRGEWTKEQIINYFHDKEKYLEKLYSESTLKHSPNENVIKGLLIECLEMHYGSIKDAVKTEIPINKILDDMDQYIQKIRNLI
ncbi:MAG TPA: nucleotidyltransferase domain-containing protein [Candidatus Glassbacteria bacterium]|nr:nucleotidyltransferase domain-containing protein [Candidatus Glassbacteria bacterium]